MKQKYVFKKAEIKKKEFYTWLKQMLVDAGWENISSRPSTDFDVFFSEGESGKDKLFFQMKEYTGASTGNAMSSSSERFFDVKLLMNYIPGALNVAGTLERSNEAFHRMQISTGLVSVQSDMTVYYHINKNRIIVMTEFPIGIEQDSVLFMIGKPDEHLSRYYPNGSMMLFTTTSYNGVTVAVDEADSTRRGSYALTALESLPPRVQNSSGLHFMSELAVGSNSEGIKALIEGVYIIANEYSYNENANRGDLLKDEKGNIYRIFHLATRTSSTYTYYTPSRYMALMIESGDSNGNA